MPDNFALIAATVTFNAGLRGAEAITAIVTAYGSLIHAARWFTGLQIRRKG